MTHLCVITFDVASVLAKIPKWVKNRPTILHGYFFVDSNFQRSHFGLEEASKQLCLVGGHFYFGTRGCARN